MNRYPWDNTTENIAAQDDTRYETPQGAQQKADKAEQNAKNYTDNKLSLPELPIPNGAVVERHIRSENVTERTIAQKAVTRSKIGTGAVGSQELDSSLLKNFGDIAVQAKFQEVDNKFDDMTKVRKLKVGEELNALLTSYNNISIDEGIYDVTVPVSNLANKSIIGVSPNKSILKLSDSAFFDMLNARNLLVENITIQVSITNENKLLKLKCQMPGSGTTAIWNIKFKNVKLIAVDYANPTIANYYVTGKYTGLSIEAVNPYGMYNCYFDLQIVNPNVGFEVVSHTPTTSDGWITTCHFDLEINNFSLYGLDLETNNFFTNTFNLKLVDINLAGAVRTAVKFGPGVTENIINSIILFRDGSDVGFSLFDVSDTAIRNTINSGYVEGKIVGYNNLIERNSFNCTWVDVDNKSKTGGVISAELSSNLNNIFGNGNMLSGFLGKYYTATAGATYTLFDDLNTQFGRLLRISSPNQNGYVALNCDPSFSFMIGKMVTMTVKAKTTSQNFRVGFNLGSTGVISGRYHSGSGSYELLTVTATVRNTASSFNPILQMLDAAGSSVDIEWIVVSIGSVAPTQYIAHANNYNFKEYRSGPPAVGTFKVGDILWNPTPSNGGVSHWECTTAGTPGTWTPVQVGVMNSISAAPLGQGFIAVVSGVIYMAKGTASAADWVQISN